MEGPGRYNCYLYRYFALSALSAHPLQVYVDPILRLAMKGQQVLIRTLEQERLCLIFNPGLVALVRGRADNGHVALAGQSAFQSPCHPPVTIG